jgi:hypothetical protein
MPQWAFIDRILTMDPGAARHVSNGGLHQKEPRPGIDGEQLVPVGLSAGNKGPPRGDPARIHQPVDAAKSGKGRLGNGCRCVCVRQISRDGRRIRAVRQFPGQRVASRCVAVRQHQRAIAHMAAAEGVGATDAACSTRDNDDLALQPYLHARRSR